MGVMYVVFAASVCLFGGSAVLALVWAIKSGEFRDMQAGARSIFDEDESIGRITDRFPGESP